MLLCYFQEEGKKQRDPSVHPFSCPEEMHCAAQHTVLWWWRRVLGTPRSSSSPLGRARISSATQPPSASREPSIIRRDGKCHRTDMWLRLRDYRRGGAPRGPGNKAKLKLVHESMIRAKWYWLPMTPAENKLAEGPFGGGRPCSTCVAIYLWNTMCFGEEAATTFLHRVHAQHLIFIF